MKSSFNTKLLFVLKVILVLIVVTFVWFHININNNNENTYENNKTFLTKSKSNSNESDFYQQISYESLNKLRKTVESLNRRQNVFNYETFGPLLDNSLVIVIQVHNRLKYLLDLIKSLEKTKDIEEVLLVFSHDFFDEEINSLITSIKFCKVIQIFYPKSLQLNPNSFPGHSLNDCPRDMSTKEALKIGCNNAMNADTYGHYREANVCQTKHHFWWKINIVFDKLEITRTHPGYFMFLEEDHYLSPDALHVWKLMHELNNKISKKSNVITLGSYTRPFDFVRNGDKSESSKWISSRHNMGFSFNRDIWEDIKRCAKSFCTYDDYNWDWSLQYVSEKCLKSPFISLNVLTPRVYHTGECGLHHNNKVCNNKQLVNTLENLFKSSQKYLFPKQIYLKKMVSKGFRLPKPNGGWGDPRDHQLCLNQSIDFSQLF